MFDVNEPAIGATVYMDNIPMDVQNSHTQRTDVRDALLFDFSNSKLFPFQLNDIMLERLDRNNGGNSIHASHSREQLSRQVSSPSSTNQEVHNFPNDIESAGVTVINGTSVKSRATTEAGGRHVVTMQQTEK